MVTPPPSTDIPPFDEFVTVVDSNETRVVERWMREPAHEQTFSSSPPFPSLPSLLSAVKLFKSGSSARVPTKRHESTETDGEDETRATLPFSLSDRHTLKEQLEREMGRGGSAERTDGNAEEPPIFSNEHVRRVKFSTPAF
jgi:hypothetical protein